MLVTFLRTGERRYAVRVAVDGRPALEMNPAPGYDPIMPHDLQHFIVERGLGIEGGIFGQLAAGGTAGTFHAGATQGGSREASRETRKRKRQGGRLKAAHREDSMRSERAAYICWRDWLKRSDDPSLRAQAVKMKDTARGMLEVMAPDERARYTEENLAAIRSEFERLSKSWSSLKVGESLTEPW